MSLVTIIEISGLPSAGKSTLTKQLFSHFKEKGVSLSASLLGSDEIKSPIHDKGSPSYNLWHTCAAINSILEAKVANGKSILIFDRGLIDSICWMKLFLEQGKISRSEFSTFKSAAISPCVLRDVDYFYFNLNVSYECAVARGKKRNGVVGHEHYSALGRIYSEFSLQLEEDPLLSIVQRFDAEVRTTDEIFCEIVRTVQK